MISFQFYLILMVILVAVGIIVGLFVLLRSTLFQFDGLLDNLDLSGLMEKETFVQTGRLSMSTKLCIRLYRWHDPAHFYKGAEFWKTFQDGPWKWEAQERYAGKDINCGHFFALSPQGANAEAGFYNTRYLRERTLIAVEAEFDAILDLTYEENLLAMAKEALRNWHEVPDRAFFMEILSLIMHEQKGGNAFTDFLGCWAHRHGYDGVLFFGARAINAFPDLKWQIENGQDEAMAGPIVYDHFREMRSQPSLMNLVVVSGALLTTRIRAFRSADDNMETPNPYFSTTLEDLDKLLTYNQDFQDECRHKIHYLEQPLEYPAPRQTATKPPSPKPSPPAS